VALALLAVLASTLTYTGFLVIGVLADHLDTSRAVAGLLLAAVLARFPWIRNGKLRIVGLLPPPVRRPFMVVLLALCLLHFLWQGEYVPAAFTGFTTAFVLGFPRLRRSIVDRSLASVFPFAGRKQPGSSDDKVIEGEFREKKE
jgi:hypothetical protein